MDVVASSAVATSRYFEVEVDDTYIADAAYIDLATELSYTFENPTPNHTHKIRVRERAVARGETEFSGWAEASEGCDRWVPQNVVASCNSHGVVTLRWDHLDDAASYQTVGLNYEGPGGTGEQRLVHAQRQEGETYDFQVRAHTAGDWGDGDTDDNGVDNDGTCAPGDNHEKLTCPNDANGDTADPGEHTGGVCPDLVWHPTLPDAYDPWWRTAAEENLFTTTAGVSVTGAVGSKWGAKFLSASIAARYGRFAG